MQNNTKANTKAKPKMNEKKRKQILHNRLRALIQLFFFLTMPGAFVLGFSGIKYLFRWIGSGEVMQLSSFTMCTLGLFAFTILFGRFFCGYVCSFGSLGDLVYTLSGLFQKKLLKRKKQFSLPERLTVILQKLKYLNLIFICAGCTIGFYDSLTGTSVWDVFSQLTALKLPDGRYMIAIILSVLLLVGMALQERFFCQLLHT